MKRNSLLALGLAALTLILAGQALADKFTTTRLAASGSNVFAVWYERTVSGDSICFRTSADGGATWKPMKRIATGTLVDSPALAVSAPYVYVAVRTFNGTNLDIRLLRSTDRGTSWEAPISVSGEGNSLNQPSVSAALNRVDVFWQEGTPTGDLIGHNGSKNYGQTWTGRDFYIGPSGNRYSISTAAEGPMSCLSWIEVDPLTYDQGWGFFRWTNNREDLFLNMTGPARYWLSSDCGKDVAGMIWVEDMGGGVYQLKVSRLADFASGWSTPTPLESLATGPMSPSLKHSGASVYAVWYGYVVADMSQAVFFARSTDTGLTWKPEKQLSAPGRGGTNAGLAAAGSNVYVAWWEPVKTTEGTRQDLYIRKSADRGASWKAPLKIGSLMMIK